MLITNRASGTLQKRVTTYHERETWPDNLAIDYRLLLLCPLAKHLMITRFLRLGLPVSSERRLQTPVCEFLACHVSIQSHKRGTARHRPGTTTDRRRDDMRVTRLGTHVLYFYPGLGLISSTRTYDNATCDKVLWEVILLERRASHRRAFASVQALDPSRMSRFLAL